MNQTQIQQLITGAVATIGGYAVGQGWISADQIPLISGFLISAFALAYSVYASRRKAQISAVAKLPDVDSVTVDHATANSIPLTNVVARAN